jgi:hypothetical protein
MSRWNGKSSSVQLVGIFRARQLRYRLQKSFR